MDELILLELYFDITPMSLSTLSEILFPLARSDSLGQDARSHATLVKERKFPSHFPHPPEVSGQLVVSAGFSA
jgi:hypothetical protein